METLNQGVCLNSSASPVIAEPETVQSFINEFFHFNDTSEEIEETLWRMFQASISNADFPCDAAENGNQAHVYRTVSEMIRKLEKFKGKVGIDPPEN